MNNNLKQENILNNINKLNADYQTDIPDKSEGEKERQGKIENTLEEIKEISPRLKIYGSKKICFCGETKIFDSEDMHNLANLLEELESLDD